MGVFDNISGLFGDARWSSPDMRLVEGGLMSDVLVYRSYDSAQDLYFNEDSTGFIFETLPSPVSEDIPAALHSALTSHCPNDTTVQIINWASPDIDAKLAKWSAPRQGQSEIMRRAALARIAHFKRIRFGDSAIARTIPHERKLYVAVYMDGEANLTNINRLNAFKEALVSALGGATRVRSVSPKTLLDLLAELLVIRAYNEKPSVPYDPQVALNQQLVGSGLRVARKGLSFNSDPDISASAATVRSFPPEYRSALTALLAGQPDKLSSKPHGPVLTTLTMRAMPSGKTSAMLMKKHGTLEHFRGSVLGRFMPQLDETLEEVKDLTIKTEGGEKLFESVLSVIAYRAGDVEASHAALSELHGIYRAVGFELQNDQNVQFPVFLSALPFGLTKANMRDFAVTGRMKVMKARALAEIAPFYGEWSGNASGTGVLLAGRQGQVAAWNNFDATTNFNVTVTGASGSGKSVFMEELVGAHLANGGQVIVIDDGYSFARLCKAYDGQFVAFDGSEEIRLNPFSLIDPAIMSDTAHPNHVEYRAETLELITKTVATMASLSDHQSGRVQDIEEDIIREAVSDIWDQFGADSEITHVRDLLRERAKDEARLSDIVTKLSRFSRGGDYGTYFEGKAKLSLTSPFAVFELSDIKQQRGLDSVLMQLIMFLASEAMFKSPRNQAVSIVIDEAWDLLHADMTGKFLEGIIRRARKYRGGLVSGTQSLSDYDRSLAAKVCREMSATQVMLKQNGETIDAAQASGMLNLSPAAIHHLKSLHAVPGHFSELAIRNEDGSFIFGRLLLDPYSLALYSSNAETVSRVQALQQSGAPLADALSQVAYSGDAL